MATELTKPVTRSVKVKDAIGKEGAVNVTISGSGVAFSKGRRKFQPIPWEAIANLVVRPGNLPGPFVANPLGWLTELDK